MRRTSRRRRPTRRNTAARVTCPLCAGKKVVRGYDWRGGYNVRCGACKGTGAVSPAAWLRAHGAMPREDLTRRDAIALLSGELGLYPDGTPDPTRGGPGIAENGLGGLLLDVEARGWGDISGRFLARYAVDAPAHYPGLLAFMDKARAMRARL